MSGLHLKLRSRPEGDIDAEALGGELRGLAAAQANELRLPCLGSNQSLTVGDWFDVSSRGDDRVVIEGDLRHFHRVGAGWSGGQLVVEGDVGDAFASQMGSGSISLFGSASAGAAEQMSGGELRIHGDVGDDLGRPLPGRRSGIRGGRVIVGGRSGHGAGYRMRRGTMLILGGCGDCLGCDLVAGTIVVAGSIGDSIAAGMRRGTIVVPDSARLSQVRFTRATSERLGITRLLAADLMPDASRIAMSLEGAIERSLGDLTAGGMGEIWLYRQ